MRILKSIRSRANDPEPQSDEALLAAIAKGDMTAFERLHRKYFPKLMHFAKRMTNSPEAAEEVANDVLMTVWRTADRFEGRSKPSTWMFGIAYRMALKQREKIGKRRGDVELDEGMVADDKDTAEAVILSTDLFNALKKLTPELQAVVELTYYNGYLYTEIAEILDCPVGTVKTRMMTARRRLRTMLSDTDITGTENEVA
ncbi:RNA polymerase sigma factor [Loktanella sp. D2R18]|uniref:RNA polymerase sigma factor n=1 Tax=Rhodobacterales TaxID=204455 RepID=UPI000DEA80A7|nr:MULTISPECIES: sigma-70 family RNA polymerase sigma factor [Rhodobacterales]MDO6590532.1 sigma-70 family RNA polymerase sigma factor [Yoonia sp. 1_MG-2023]RBW41249.1 RNA polymerase sigma factor [Loktanella sp. D2R18]